MGSVYFGTRDYMQWVKAPAVNVDASKFGWSNQTNYLGGGANVRRSLSSHKEYNFSWNLATRDDLRPIMDYADGIFGMGALYYLDPFTMDRNVLPAYLAAPFMGAYDGPILAGSARPTLTPTNPNVLGYPVQSASYTVPATVANTYWIPIPVGYTLWVGAHGVAGSGGVVVVVPTTGATSIGTPTSLTMMDVTDTNRFNSSFDGTQYTGAFVRLGGTGTLTVSGIMAQVLPTGQTPQLGGFISGQGHSGLSFAGQPTMTEYNSALDKVGLSAKLVETVAWL